MRLTTCALVAALIPASAGAIPQSDPRANAQRNAEVNAETKEMNVASSRDGRLGVMVMELTPELRAYFGAPRDSGLLIAQVVPDSAAARAGVRVGDVITRFGND